MTTLFQAVDPMDITVTCTTERWQEHVLRRHPEMSGYEDLAELAISEPFAIYRSGQPGLPYPTDLYYAVSGLPYPRNRGFVKVVSERVPAGVGVEAGRFLTAFHSDAGPSEQDELIWATTQEQQTR